MKLLSQARHFLRNLLRKQEVEEDLDQETRSLLELLIEEKTAAGLSPKEARRRALMELGGSEQIKSKVREIRMGKLFEDLWQDIRYGLRALRKNPGFTTVAVLTLALGIGVNAAMFSVVNAVLLRPIPFAEQERLVGIWSFTSQEEGNRRTTGSVLDFKDWEEQTRLFEAMAARVNLPHVLILGEEADRIPGAIVSHAYFQVLGVRPQLGRTFLPQDDKLPVGENVAILSHSLWERRFNADPGVIGKGITLDERPFTVVGVMPRSFTGILGRTDIWTPFTALIPRLQPFVQRRSARPFRVYGRLKVGVTPEQAEAELNSIARGLEEQYPDTNAGYGVQINPLHEQLVGDFRQTLFFLLGAVGLVLLVACVNIANLLFARSAARQKEIAVRAALGSGRWRIVRQLMTESLLLSFLGGAVGLLLALWLIQFLPALSATLPGYIEIDVDLTVLLFTIVAACVAGLLYGVTPAWQLGKTDLARTLKETGRTTSVGLLKTRFRNLLAVAEIALALLLLVGSGLLIRSFFNLQTMNPGFRTEGAVTARVDLPDLRYTFPQAVEYARQVIAQLDGISGVESASASSDIPLGGDGTFGTFIVPEGRTEADLGATPVIRYHQVSFGYFRTVGTPILRGRMLDSRDRENTEAVAVLSESAARLFWPEEDALGQRFRFRTSRKEVWYRVVGIAHDVRYTSFTDRDAHFRDLYIPLSQPVFPFPWFNFTLRTATDPATLTSFLVGSIHAVDPNVPIFNINTFEQLVEANLTQNRFLSLLASAFALLALLLASVGVYGVISYSVSQRTKEIGIRMALGAQPVDIFRLVTRQGILIAGFGVASGLVAALTLMRFLESQLFGVASIDTLTFVAVPLLLTAVVLLASYLPALRATKVDPMVALRYE